MVRFNTFADDRHAQSVTRGHHGCVMKSLQFQLARYWLAGPMISYSSAYAAEAESSTKKSKSVLPTISPWTWFGATPATSRH